MSLHPLRAVTCGFAALALVLLSTASANAADHVSDLLGWVPGRTNLALFIDADKMMKSEVAKKGKWGAQKQLATGVQTLPPGVSHLIVAADYAPGAGLNWEVLVVGLRKKMTDEDLIAGTGGKKDSIAERTVALTPRHGYAVNLAPGVAGAYQPPNRQEAARWLRAANGKVSGNLSPYIKQAAAGVAGNTPIVLAIDTTDMLDATLVEAKLAPSATFKGKAALVKPIAKLFSDMNGLTMTISTTDKITCQIQLDFNQPTDPFKTVAKPLLLEVMEKLGVQCDEMDGWTATVAGKTVTIGGALTEDGMRELLAPFVRGSVSSLDQTEPTPPAENTKAQKSLKYFHAVQAKMDEVRKSKNPDFAKLASHFNVGARGIDDLPILGVDDELLDWGHAIAVTFRTMAINAQTAGGMITLADGNRAMAMVTTPNYYTGTVSGYAGGYYGAAGWSGSYAIPNGTVTNSTVSNYGQIDNLIYMTNAQEADYRRNTWKNINTATSEIRRKMVKKYEIEF
jgi:hypothetical protein